MIKTNFIFIIMLTILWPQFIDVNVELDTRRISEGNRHIFETLSEDIENYYLNTQFSSDVNNLDLLIEIRLIIESVSRGGNQTTINAQAIISNKLDQYFYAKSIQFPYERGRKIYYSTSFDPLASLLNYYALTFIATELDTYDYLGGTTFFNKAIEIADLGKDSDWSSGWDDRWKKSRKIKNNNYLRSMRFNYFKAVDELSSEKVDIKIINESMLAFYEELKTLDKKLGSNKETLHFLKAYNQEIAQLLSILDMVDALELLIFYDHDHKKIYESYLKN